MAPLRRRLRAVFIVAVLAAASLVAAPAAVAASPSITLTVTYPTTMDAPVGPGSASVGEVWVKAKGKKAWVRSSWESTTWSAYDPDTRQVKATIRGLNSGTGYQIGLNPWTDSVAPFFVATAARAGTSDPLKASVVPAGTSVSATLTTPHTITGTVTFPAGSNRNNRSARVVALSSSSPTALPEGMFDGPAWSVNSSSKARYAVSVLPGARYRVGVAPSETGNDVYGTQWATPSGASTTSHAKAAIVTSSAARSITLKVPKTTIWPQPVLVAKGRLTTANDTWKAGRKLSVGGLSAWPKGVTAKYSWALRSCESQKKIGTRSVYAVTAADAKILNEKPGFDIEVTVTIAKKGYTPATHRLSYGRGACGWG